MAGASGKASAISAARVSLFIMQMLRLLPEAALAGARLHDG
jgi:hypothetical protein